MSHFWFNIHPYVLECGIPLLSTGVPCLLFFLVGEWMGHRGLQREKRAAFRAALDKYRPLVNNPRDPVWYVTDAIIDADLREYEKSHTK